jgi:hypothetical protein
MLKQQQPKKNTCPQQQQQHSHFLQRLLIPILQEIVFFVEGYGNVESREYLAYRELQATNEYLLD